MNQYNENGLNIAKNLGNVNLYNGIKKDDWLQLYDPSDDIEIRYYINEQWVEKIENNLYNKKVCLIKASEGRGKTCLSRIIAQKYSKKGYEVWFGDITKPEASGESLKQWCKVKNTNCLVILENLHSCKDNEELECLINSINSMRNPLWYNNGNNKLFFLLNTRSTSEDFDTLMLDLGKEVIEELEPNIEYCKGVAKLSKRPIEDKILDSFLKSKRFGFGQGNANLRLLGIILEIWETDESLLSIQNVNENKIILRFKTKYDLGSLKETEKGYLMFLSSIFQFDIPLPKELLKIEESDFLNTLCNDKHLVIDKEYKFYLPHSVDASYLSKAIGGRQYINQTQVKILDFVNRILKNETPRAFESDFRLLIHGLIGKKNEFQALINELADWPMAEKIIKNIDPGFVIVAFDTRNGHSSQEILEYCKENIDWLKTFIPELSIGSLSIFCHHFKKQLNHNIIEDIFKVPKDLDNYLRIDDKVFLDPSILRTIGDLGEEHRLVLITYYMQNIDRLKQSFLELNPVRLVFICQFFQKYFDHNIIGDIFKDPKDLDKHLRIDDRVFIALNVLKAIVDLGDEHKYVLINYYKQNADRLKQSFLKLNPTLLSYICRFFKSCLNHSIIEDIFKDPKELDNQLKADDRVFFDNDILKAIVDLGDEHKLVLINHYQQNIDRLNSSFIKLNLRRLNCLYLFFKTYLNHNIFEDFFSPEKDLDNHLKIDVRLFHNKVFLKAIGDFRDEYKLLLINYYKQNADRLKQYFFKSNPVEFYSFFLSFKYHLDYNIFKDFFKNPKELDDYLRMDNGVFLYNDFLKAIIGLGDEHKYVLINYFKQNADRLKTFFLELSLSQLNSIYRLFKSYLNYNIFEDIFKNPIDLDDHLKTEDILFHNNGIIKALSTLGNEYKLVLINQFKQNDDRLKTFILGLSPESISGFYITFKNQLNYNILEDVFKDIKDLSNYLKINDSASFDQQFLTAIGDIGNEHKHVLEKYIVNRYGDDYFFSTTKKDYCISRQHIDNYWEGNDDFDITRIDINSLYFYQLDWRDMQRFIKIIHKNMNDNNRQRSIEMVEAIIQIVLDKKDSLSFASARNLSFFFANITSIDKTTCQKLLEDEIVTLDIKKRLNVFTYTTDNLYLFSRFYSQPWCKRKMDLLIDNADEEQQKVIKEWHDKVMEGLQKGGKTTESKSMLDYIHNKFVNEQQNN